MGNKVGNLSDVITKLETQTEDIGNFAKVLNEIGQISKEAEKLDKKVSENMQTYITTSEMIKKSAGQLDNRLDALEKMFAKGVDELYKDNKNYHKELDDSIRVRLEKIKIDIELSVKTQINEIDKKLTLVLEEYEKDRNRGVFARFFNT